MSFNPSSLSGATYTGWTTPGFTLTADQTPNGYWKQWYVSAFTGTVPAGAHLHTASKPFTVSVMRPSQLKVLPVANPTTGIVKEVPVNTYKLIVRYGSVPLVNNSARVNNIIITFNIFAGTETNEADGIAALCLAAADALYGNVGGIIDTLKTGTI